MASPCLTFLQDATEKESVQDVANIPDILTELRTVGRRNIELKRFKGLGEMNPAQLRETTMHPESRSLIRITLPPEFEDRAAVKELVGQLMGRNPEHRYQFIQNKAGDLDRELIDA